MKNIIIVLIAIANFVSGCSTVFKPIEYKAMKNPDNYSETGYEDSKIAENLYRVRFQGNGFNTSTQVYKFFLRRAAEVTKAQGWDYFTIENGQAKGYQNGPQEWPGYEGNVRMHKTQPKINFFRASNVLSEMVDNK